MNYMALKKNLDVTIQLPEAPWYPANPDGYSARWVLLHVLEELAARVAAAGSQG